MPTRKSMPAAGAVLLLIGAGATYAQHDLSVPTTSAEQGETVEIPVTYTGDGTAIAVQLDLAFELLLLTPGSPSSGNAAADHVLRDNLITPGDLRFVLYSPTNATLNDGAVTIVPFTIPDDATLGVTDLILSSVVLGDADALPLAPTLTDGSIEILEHFLKVAAIQTVAATDDGLLTPGERTTTSITQLAALFTDPVLDPAGDTDANDVTNPDNYLLVATGPDGALATTDCVTGLDPNDLAVALDQVIYDEASLTSVLKINGADALPMGAYRLIICGSTSIVETDGTPLDGDLDGAAGGDFVQNFRVLVTNLLFNPNFDDDLSPWTLNTRPPTEIIQGTGDADGFPTSGSAKVAYAGGEGATASLSQCVPVGSEGIYQTGSRVRVSSGLASEPRVTLDLDFYPESDCTGPGTASEPLPAVLGDTAGVWSDQITGIVTAPPDALSARVSFTVEAGATPAFEVDLDNLFFYRIDIFVDSFETGDTTRWSATQSPP